MFINLAVTLGSYYSSGCTGLLVCLFNAFLLDKRNPWQLHPCVGGMHTRIFGECVYSIMSTIILLMFGALPLLPECHTMSLNELFSLSLWKEYFMLHREPSPQSSVSNCLENNNCAAAYLLSLCIGPLILVFIKLIITCLPLSIITK